jgi:3-methylcrotonyl-CoA carboxylase beta subunit
VRIWDDGILDPVDTRQAIALAIALAANRHVPDYRPGVYRM